MFYTVRRCSLCVLHDAFKSSHGFIWLRSLRDIRCHASFAQFAPQRLFVGQGSLLACEYRTRSLCASLCFCGLISPGLHVHFRRSTVCRSFIHDPNPHVAFGHFLSALLSYHCLYLCYPLVL